jgi:hypothetical protein
MTCRRSKGLILPLLLLCCGALGCGGQSECNIDAASRALGGAGIIDCRIAFIDEAAAVDQCAVETYQANGTFRALYELEDGTIEAIVHAAGGRFHMLVATADNTQVEQADCEGAHVRYAQGRTYVQCDDPAPFQRVCP